MRAPASIGGPRTSGDGSQRFLRRQLDHLYDLAAPGATIAVTMNIATEASIGAGQPLYKGVKLLITQGRMAGEWRPGQAIPSESRLAGRFGVSLGTVRKAIDELVAEKILVRHQGRGTFVAAH